jgi:hypothetical protein
MSRGSTQPVSTQAVAAGPPPGGAQPVLAQPKSGLGRTLSVYRGLPLQWSELLFVYLPASLLVIAPLTYGLWRAWYAYTTFGPAAASAWARPWYQLATLALVPFSLLSVHRMFLASRYVAVHENGLRLRFSPFREVRLAWEDLTGIASAAYQEHFLGIAFQLRPQITLFRAKGRPIRLDSRLQKTTSLTRRIKSNLYPRLWPLMADRWQAGRAIGFNRLTVHPKAFYLGKQPVPWEQVARLGVRSGFLVIELETGGPVRFPVAEVPNLELLFQLVEWGINS